MTAQFSDLFRYQNKEFSLAEVSGGELFKATDFGLFPIPASTACWRGYLAIYTVSASNLVLDTLFINLHEGQGLAINSVTPAKPTDRYSMFNNVYRDLGYRLQYTGSLLLGDEFIRELYVHMGFHPTWKYKTVIELTFENGTLTGEFDRSENMAQLRRIMQNSSTENKATGNKS